MLYRRIKAVDISLLLEALPALPWQLTQNNDEVKSLCYAVHSELPPVFKEFVDSLELGGVTERSFLRKLIPYSGIPPHVDTWVKAENRRFQVPLVSDRQVRMIWPDDDVELWLQPGYLYEVDFSRKHAVINNSTCWRTHLQIDQVGSTVEPLNS